MSAFFKHYWPSGIVFAVILYATLWPDPAGVDDFPHIPHIDKIIHAIMFGGFAGAIAFDNTRSRHALRPSRNVMLATALAAALFGGVIELTQDFMGLGRGCDVFDFIADSVGATVAFFTAPQAIQSTLKRLYARQS